MHTNITEEELIVMVKHIVNSAERKPLVKSCIAYIKNPDQIWRLSYVATKLKKYIMKNHPEEKVIAVVDDSTEMVKRIIKELLN
jgi:hypothetical protein